MRKIIAKTPKRTTANWSTVDLGHSSLSCASSSVLQSEFSSFIPSQSNTWSLILSVGKNSNKASDLSDLRRRSDLSGRAICHSRMNMTNYRRFIIFHRYFMPTASIRLNIRVPIENVDIAASSASSNSLSSSSS